MTDQADTVWPGGAIFDARGYFEGFTGRECGEHRTVGDYRAWCYDCREWCYPADPCERCARGRIVALADEGRALRAERDRAFTERDIADATRIRLTAEIAAARDQIAAVLRDVQQIEGDLRIARTGATKRLLGNDLDALIDRLAALSQSGQPTKGEPA